MIALEGVFIKNLLEEVDKKSEKPCSYWVFRIFQIIPTRRIISVSKFFGLENIIRGGSFWYQLYSSYGLYGFFAIKNLSL